MRRELRSLAILTLFLLPWLGRADETGLQTTQALVVSIVPLDGNKAQVPCWSPAVGQAITEMLVESLGKAGGKFQVLANLEPNAQPAKTQSGEPVSHSMGEKPPGAGGERSKKSAAEAPDNSPKSDSAASPSSDFMLCGNVTEFGTQTNSSKIGDFISSSPFGGLGAKMVTAHVIIDWRLVDTETKMVVTRGSGVGTAHGSEFDVANLAPAKGNSATGGINQTKTVANAVPATNPKPVANVKPVSNGKGESSNLALANNIFSGLGKALGSPAAGGGGDNGDGNHGPATGERGASANSHSKAQSKSGGESDTGGGEVIGYDNSLFMESALGKATLQAVNGAIEQLTAINLPEPVRRAKMKAATETLKHTPGKVLAVASKDAIIVSLGSNQSFRDGDHVNLYQTVDIKDDKGNVVYTDEKLVGELTLESVQADRSRASYAGDITVQQGWVVKAK